VAARRVFAAFEVAAERRRAAAFDGMHHFQLVEAHMTAVGLTPGGTVIAEDVRDLESRLNHEMALSRQRPRSVSLCAPAARRFAAWLKRSPDTATPETQRTDSVALAHEELHPE
jgi:hypothetical protein